ncbi:MAG: acyl-CoA dehydrogenase [Chloroflexi bacterium]|nr:MAG: acyl-CoA dehydrogenase [Chloroflexota bacterium]
MSVLPELDLGPAAATFRGEVRAFLAEHWSERQQAMHRRNPQAERGFDRDFTRLLAERGWLGVSWPKRWGGQQRSAFEQLAFVEEMEYHRAPVRAHTMAVSIVGPTLMAHGSEEQQQRFLPAILRGEHCVCLGYSEPDAGSDLASLRSRAQSADGGWVIDGAKLYTTMAELADHCWLAARTDSDAEKHAGISVFLVPMSTPGITIRPMEAMSGGRTNAVFFDGVRVGADALVGAPGGGWAIITEALTFERVMLGGRVARVRRELDELIRHLAIACDAKGAPLGSDPRVRDLVGSLVAEVEASRLLAVRCVAELEGGRVPHHQAAMAKIVAAELEERLAEVALDLGGPAATLAEGAPGAELDGLFEQVVRASVLDVIGGGTNDIQRTLVAVRGLHLPR